MNKIRKNCVNTDLLIDEKDHDKFLCCICLQLMTNPHATNCQGEAKHVFGINCIKEWIESKGGNKECPLCRKSFNKLEFQEKLAVEAASFSAKCPQCQLIVSVTQIQAHLYSCEKYLSNKKAKLEEIVAEQKLWLQKQINPHLRMAHCHIYQTYVQDWKWLSNDGRNWKWWWWCSNPWWQNKSCPTCNQLWHKYEKEIDELENKRLHILGEIGIGVEEEDESIECEHT